MDTDHLDTALLDSAMGIAAARGWSAVTLPDAARDAGLDLNAVRKRFPFRNALLLRLGALADQAALVDDGSRSPPREALFDLLMRRFDVFQQYRQGVVAVMNTLPFDPILTGILGIATTDSMKWIAGSAGIDVSGFPGCLRVKGTVAVWMHALRVWKNDESEDLGSTMAALEEALTKAERFGLFRGSHTVAAGYESGKGDFKALPSLDAGS